MLFTIPSEERTEKTGTIIKSKSSNEMMCSNTDKEERAFMKMSQKITVSSSCDLEKTEKTFFDITSSNPTAAPHLHTSI